LYFWDNQGQPLPNTEHAELSLMLVKPNKKGTSQQSESHPPAQQLHIDPVQPQQLVVREASLPQHCDSPSHLLAKDQMAGLMGKRTPAFVSYDTLVVQVIAKIPSGC